MDNTLIARYNSPDGKQVLSIHYDLDSPSPRDERYQDNLGAIVGKRGNPHGVGEIEADTIEEAYDIAREDGASVILPVYIYDHSGVVLRTTPFSCPWDSGQIGIIYTTPERIKKMGTPAERVEKVLAAEVDELASYMAGERYYYSLDNVKKCNLGHVHHEHVDSCGGIDDIDYIWECASIGVKDEWEEVYHC